MHGLAWLPNAPDVEHLMSHADYTIKDEIIHNQYADRIVCTINPGVFSDGGDIKLKMLQLQGQIHISEIKHTMK